MKNVSLTIRSFALLVLLVLAAATIRVRAADFNVTSPGFFFQINGANTPTLTLIRGRTYTFAVNTVCGFHPFRINSAGVVNNAACSGTMTYTVPTNAANYTYDCQVHGSSMQGQILTIDPPPPPTIRIVSYDFSSNIVLRSTGTNTFALFPEYKTNLNQTNWFALTVQTNRFTSGTNETICGRPPGSNLFLRIRAVGN